MTTPGYEWRADFTTPADFDCLNDSHECGSIYYSEERDISVFVDTQGLDGPKLAFYAWKGDWEAHDNAQHYDGASFEEAVEAAEAGK